LEFHYHVHKSELGAQTTVFTASGTSELLLLPVAMVEEMMMGGETTQKHVEQFTDKINCVYLRLV